ncbi:glycoside hydrolase family 3 N-terminal domain-containing protein [Terrimonas alba]|uniref:glycoside hydrolase family 3 N-terminal domain-containing protein n=1 Tax=Terrimonas alba TaxID=3349636 RepID=UPI0035F233EF
MIKRALFLLFFATPLLSTAQYKSGLSANAWVDSVFNSLSKEERIAQLMVIRAHSNLGPDHITKVTNDIQKYNVGALCFFQGGPVRQADLTNAYQSMAKTPLMITIDGEWGLGMRLDSVTKFPYQLTLGALNDDELVYKMGLAVGEQCKRLGVHVNYAPVVDINNNPNNPVIGYRSFGEDKTKVARFGVAYMKGMQDAGIMACAKHFPGHGDVDVDSHYDLPIVNKSIEQLQETELMPFKALFDAGVGSVMIAHLSIPAIDSTPNRATSISTNAVTGLLKYELGYRGLVFTDALEMKGVAKYFPGGTIAVESLIAGNDMLCLPEDVEQTIDAVKNAIKEKTLSWDDINEKVKKVLKAKYELGLYQWQPINTENLLEDLNAKTNEIRFEVAKNSLTVLRNESKAFPVTGKRKIAYVGIGIAELNAFGKRLKEDKDADTYFFSYKDEDPERILTAIKEGKYESIVIGVHDYNLRPANNYLISPVAVNLVKELQSFNAATFVFGNVLAISNFCDATNLIACYQDDDITQQAAADLLESKIVSMGRLPVSVCGFKPGAGIVHGGVKPVRASLPPNKLDAIDSIVADAIAKKAFPGCVVLAVHKGKILYNKAFGNYEYDSSPAMNVESIFDLASVTKISATTVAVMKLYEQGKLDLKKRLGNYLPAVRGTNKASLQIDDILMHQAGLVPFISFYKETIDSVTGAPNPALYSDKKKPGFEYRVAENLYLRNDWEDTLMSRIAASPLGPANKYVYSDNDFIYLGKVVEAITGMPLNEYVEKTFYRRMGMRTTGFKPRAEFAVDKIVPTEKEEHFRRQLIRGDVHDEGASMFGGVAGHAGLFSDAYDLAMLYQMLLNGGVFNGERYFKKETIELFTAYHSKTSRRGLGFDKPEKDNAKRPEPYPSASASAETFGHTGFTGTCVWVDPKANLVYVFLSNRVNPTRDNPRFGQMNIRPKIQEVLYSVIKD